MDRNIVRGQLPAPKPPVALRKESVDRNIGSINRAIDIIKSLSARRAWIEIAAIDFAPLVNGGSLSARRAWIEIVCSSLISTSSAAGRSPQGERG